jgi:hypothetical protein
MDQRLSRVYWIGGSPCSGKSTVVDALTASYGLPVYRCDEAFFRHQDLVTPERQPVFHRLSHASCDELWMRPVSEQIEEELALYREEFPFILADLAGQARDLPLLAEGAALLPELLDSIAIDNRCCVWMVPTETFQRTHYARRAWRHDTLKDCTQQEVAWENWMARDAGFAHAIATDARSRGRRVLLIDGAQPPDAVIREVAQWFELMP